MGSDSENEGGTDGDVCKFCRSIACRNVAKTGRNWIHIFDRNLIIRYFGPSTSDLPKSRFIGKVMGVGIVPMDREVAVAACRRVVELGEAGRFAFRGAITGTLWQATVNPFWTADDEVMGVATCVPVCHIGHDLPTRQRLVLRKLCNGKNVRQIAREMKVSENTVRTHILRVKKATGRSELNELIVWATKNIACFHDTEA